MCGDQFGSIFVPEELAWQDGTEAGRGYAEMDVGFGWQQGLNR